MNDGEKLALLEVQRVRGDIYISRRVPKRQGQLKYESDESWYLIELAPRFCSITSGFPPSTHLANQKKCISAQLLHKQ